MVYNPNSWAFIDPMVPYGYSANPASRAGPDYVNSYASNPMPMNPAGGANGPGGGRGDPGMSAGPPQGNGEMFRDSYAMAREFGGPSKGSVIGSIVGALTGMGPIGGTLGSWAQNAYNTTMGAREGNAARAGIGSGVPSQMALGSYLDQPSIMADLLAHGRSDEDLGPNFVDVSLEQGGYDNQNNSLGWGLAERAQADMDRAGITNNAEGEGSQADPNDGVYKKGGAIRRKKKYAQGGPVGALRMGSINTPRAPRTPTPPRPPRPTMPKTAQVHLRQAPRKYMTG